MFRILVADEIPAEGLALLRAAPDAETTDVRLGRAALLECIPRYHALIVRSGTPVDRELMERGTHLRLIGRAGLAFDNIDIEAATARGLMVMHTPQAYSVAAAEHTFALMLALCRQLPAAEADLRAGNWERERFLGVQLQGKTMALVGFGRVGQLVAARALAFGMRVLVYDPYMDDDEARSAGVTGATLDEALSRADFLSLHASLTPETARMLGTAELARMKPGARLINCARGELVDEAALFEALNSGRLSGAALDVFAAQPPQGSPLIRLKNVVVAPNLGGSTVEAQRQVAVDIAQQVMDALRGHDYRNVVNLPFIAGPNFAATRPYLDLAEKLGALQAQLAAGLPRRVEIEIKGFEGDRLVKPVAVALLKGMLSQRLDEPVNYINAGWLAARQGLSVSQARGMDDTGYTHQIACRVTWEGGHRVVAGTLFGGAESRIVQIDAFRMDARPEGHVLVMRSRDVPGVVGVVGTLLAQYKVNIAEWRLGRDRPGGTAMSFINLDSPMPNEALVALRALPQVVDVRTIRL